MILGSIYDFSIPFDNHLVEWYIRMMKVKKKSPDVSAPKKVSIISAERLFMRRVCRIISYISSAKKQGLNVFDALLSVFDGKPIFNF